MPHRFFVFCFLIFTCLSQTLFAQNEEGTLSDDLNKVMGTFTSARTKNTAPTLEQLLSVTGGTLVFFDNSESTGDTIYPDGTRVKKKTNFITDTLNRAKQRLFEQENVLEANQRFKNVFTSPEISPSVTTPTSNAVAPKLYGLNYSGAKTIARIPPDTFIEVPFLKHIPYFFSRVEIYGDGSIGVTETIQRVVEKNEPFFGIDRYFSKYHTDRQGRKYRTFVTVLDASVDGRPLESRLSPSLFGVRVSLHDTFPLPEGVYTYTISYLFKQKVADFKGETSADDFKELIWSATGNHWAMPITRAATTLIFPKETMVLSQTGATGRLQNYTIKKDIEGNLSFTLSYPLAQGESLTVLANWKEQNPAPVPEDTWLDTFIIEHGTTLSSFIAFLFILSYYLMTLTSLKKNQIAVDQSIKPAQKGDFSPVVLSYALTQKNGSKSLFILLTSMATKGFISFSENNSGDFIVIKETDKETGLSSLEKKIARLLFEKTDTSFAFSMENKLRVSRMMLLVDKTIKKEYDQKFITLHQTYLWFGILMAFVSICFISSLSLFTLTTFVTALCCVGLSIPLCFVGQALYVAFKEKAKASWYVRVLLSIILTPLTCALFVLLWFYGEQTTPTTSFFLLLTISCIIVFYSKLKSPSFLGKSIIENMEGYRLYLCAQNETLLTAMRNAPTKLKSLYNKHLPFAQAFDLDRVWTERFIKISGNDLSLKPDWYKGNTPFDESFMDQVIALFNKNISEKTPPLTRSRYTKRP